VRAKQCFTDWKSRVSNERGLSKLNSVIWRAHDHTLSNQVDVLPGFRIHHGTDALGAIGSRGLMDADLRCWSPQIPRKEVIQPHLPVRLPCYDFTPITEPTFDGSLPCGLGHRLRVFPAFVV
jgi:hypothetical protein